jgi:hypothetical protein
MLPLDITGWAVVLLVPFRISMLLPAIGDLYEDT